tara:strand:- start:3963 stop:4571 length:609 start_codon:yes stop_codon:yes gene_type:complete
MIVKVCGLKEIKNINQLNEIDIDLMGFIFYNKSSRFIKQEINISNLTKKKVGVFVNESLENIKKKIKEYDLNYVQLHGDETPKFSKKLMNYCKVIKVFRISENFDFNSTNQYTDCCDLFLFDTFSKKFGGSGKKFDWNKIKSFNNKKFLLSGGIDIDSIDEIKGVKNENEFFLGIDINSKFEIYPGLKDIKKVNMFLKKLNK